MRCILAWMGGVWGRMEVQVYVRLKVHLPFTWNYHNIVNWLYPNIIWTVKNMYPLLWSSDWIHKPELCAQSLGSQDKPQGWTTQHEPGEYGFPHHLWSYLEHYHGFALPSILPGRVDNIWNCRGISPTNIWESIKNWQIDPTSILPNDLPSPTQTHRKVTACKLCLRVCLGLF